MSMDEVSMASPNTGCFLGLVFRTPGYQKVIYNEQLLT